MNTLYQTIETLIDSCATAFIASVDEAGYPCCKALLAPRVRNGLRIFYFTTNTSSQHTMHYRSQPKATIYFCDESNFRGVLLRGKMIICEDQPTKDLIWRSGDTEYYPLGPNDPDYCVLRFEAEHARYYSDLRSQELQLVPPRAEEAEVRIRWRIKNRI